MNDTPRTDEFIGEYSEWSPSPRKNWPAFARTLERELNEAKELIKRLEVAAWKNYNNAHKEKEGKP